MIFDLFHSVSDPVVEGKSLGAKRSFANFLEQARLAEDLGASTLWLAESHFSSEVQKKTSLATIPEFYGEVGLNADSFQWFHILASQTKHIGLGTGIHNIVGGSGGPIASADRVNSLAFINENIWKTPRELRIGVAAGRFPYQNAPFGIAPRDADEKALWPALRPKVFVEALEVFLRLVKGEVLASTEIAPLAVTEAEARKALGSRFSDVSVEFPYAVKPRWIFEKLALVPRHEPKKLHIVLGSSDPEALERGAQFWDLDLFNLSFTPPAEIEKLHAKLTALQGAHGRKWSRDRLPRTVMVFIDPDRNKARSLANSVIDTYIEAMRGTAMVPDKTVLLERALIGDAAEVRDQLHPENSRGFNATDRLMLWFEFNQLDNAAICRQMRYFYDEVAAKV